MTIRIITILAVISYCLAAATPPVVLFHGLGDACKNKGFSRITQTIGKSLETYSVCLEIGNGGETSFFKNFKKQAE